MMKIKKIGVSGVGEDIVQIYDDKVSIKAWKEEENSFYFEDVPLEKIEYCKNELPNYRFKTFVGDNEEPFLKDKIISCIEYKINLDEIIAEGSFSLRFYKSKWSYLTLKKEIEKQIYYVKDLKISEVYDDEDIPGFIFQKTFDNNISLPNIAKKLVKDVEDFIHFVEKNLNGFVWKDEYEKDELLFCHEVVTPLLRKMPFDRVKYLHGTHEYGKDYIVSDIDSFGFTSYYGIQVKAGNIDGRVNSKIDEIIAQMDDAFSMPIINVDGLEEKYISNFVVMISGNYTYHAKQKIKYKIKNHFLGSVYFLDKEDILKLIEKYC